MKALFLFFVSYGVFATEADRCVPSRGDCKLYSCLAKNLGCSSESYLTKFGEKICGRFLTVSEKNFSREAVKALGNIRFCLQERLAKKSSCAKIDIDTLEDHVACYSNPEFCQLELSDRAKLSWMMRDYFISKEFWEKKQYKASKRISAYCKRIEKSVEVMD